MWRHCLAGVLLAVPLAACAHGRTGALADVEIVDSGTGRALPLLRHHGRWYVAGEPGREYQIRVRNRGPGRLLAVTSVDGVNVVTGQTADPRQSGYVLGAFGSVDVDGWRKSLDHVARFYFTDLGDAYATRTGRPDDVGVIGVALFREHDTPQGPWREDDSARDSAAAEGGAPAPAAKAQRAEPRLGTGHGRSDWSQAYYTDFERASEQPDEIISIWYDSRRNLVAMGVIAPEPYRPWHRPNPFPAQFVPDP